MLSRRWHIAFVSFLMLVAGAFFLWSVRRSSPQPVQLTMNSPLNPVTGGAISANGEMLAYSDDAGIHLKHLKNGKAESVLLARQADAHSPSSVPLPG